MNSSARVFVPAFLLSVALIAPAFAQFSNPQSKTTTVHNATALRPPAGARVAIVEFEDLECPDCARANPVIKEAIEKYHIPWVRHDFPLPFHTWSFQAAVDARWFDTKSKKLGDDFRDATFAAQASIHSQDDLQVFAQKFAADHKLSFPFVVDPQGNPNGSQREVDHFKSNRSPHDTVASKIPVSIVAPCFICTKIR
jgi:hypothetical protein